MTQNEKIWEHRITKIFHGVEKKEPPRAFLYSSAMLIRNQKKHWKSI